MWLRGDFAFLIWSQASVASCFMNNLNLRIKKFISVYELKILKWLAVLQWLESGLGLESDSSLVDSDSTRVTVPNDSDSTRVLQWVDPFQHWMKLKIFDHSFHSKYLASMNRMLIADFLPEFAVRYCCNSNISLAADLQQCVLNFLKRRDA